MTNKSAIPSLEISVIVVYVEDQELALKFWKQLQFTVDTDEVMEGNGGRWIELKPPKGGPTLSIYSRKQNEADVKMQKGHKIWSECNPSFSFNCSDAHLLHKEMKDLG